MCKSGYPACYGYCLTICDLSGHGLSCSAGENYLSIWICYAESIAGQGKGLFVCSISSCFFLDISNILHGKACLILIGSVFIKAQCISIICGSHCGSACISSAIGSSLEFCRFFRSRSCTWFRCRGSTWLWCWGCAWFWCRSSAWLWSRCSAWLWCRC